MGPRFGGFLRHRGATGGTAPAALPGIGAPEEVLPDLLRRSVPSADHEVSGSVLITQEESTFEEKALESWMNVFGMVLLD